MDQATLYCTVGGLCYNLASTFLLKVPWDKVLKDSLQTSAKKVWSSRSAYAVVLKEAQLAMAVFDQFKRTVAQMEDFQENAHVQICSLTTAKSFVRDYEKVLEMYTPENISTWQANVSGETLRQQLQYYSMFMHSTMSTIMLDIAYVNMQLQVVAMEPEERQKDLLMSKLRTCHWNRSYDDGNYSKNDENFS